VRRWGRRHRLLVTSSVVLLATAVVALAISTLLIARAQHLTALARDSEAEQKKHALEAEGKARAEAERAEKAADRAEKASQRAAAEAQRARRVTELVAEMFVESDPIGLSAPGVTPGMAKGQKLTVRELLDNSRTKIKDELKEDPIVRAALLAVRGDLYRSLGLYKDAKPLLEEALAIRRRHLAGDDLDLAASLHHLGWLNHDLGDYDAARPLYDEALKIRRRRTGDKPDALVASSLLHVAWLHGDEHEYEPAKKLFQETIELRRRLTGNESRDVAIALTALAATLLDERQHLEAAPLLLEAMRIFGKQRKGNEGLAAFLEFCKGVGYKQANLHARAEASLRKCIKQLERLLGDGHPYVGFARFELADALAARGDQWQAEQLYRDCCQVARETVGLQNPKTILPVNRLSEMLAKRGQKEEWRKLMQEILDVRRKFFPGQHREVGAVLLHLGDLELGHGSLYRARRSYLEAIAHLEQNEKGRISLAFALNGLGNTLIRTGLAAEAEPYYRRSLALIRNVHQSLRPQVAFILGNLADALLAQQKFREAEPLLQEALAIRRERGMSRLDSLILLEKYGNLLWIRGKVKEGKGVFQEALDLARAEHGPNHPALLLRLTNLSAVLSELEEHEAAQKHLDQGLALTLAQHGASDLDVIRWYRYRALMRLARGDVAGYRGDCAELVKRFATVQDGKAAHLVARTVALAAEPGSALETALTLARRAQEVSPQDPSCCTTLAAALFRQGRYGAALYYLSEAQKQAADRVIDLFYLSMTCRRLGQAARADDYREQALQVWKRVTEEHSFRLVHPAGTAFDDRLELRILRREAEKDHP
jgi:tetratricopeptide (TPR) repeat protein